MSNNLKKTVWLIGAGQIAIEYFKVLINLKVVPIVIGRGEESAKNFSKITGHSPIIGGIEKFLATNPITVENAIVTVQVNFLADVTIQLLKVGVKNILVEKPAALNRRELRNCVTLAHKVNSKVFIAYNRRFYSSVQKAKKIIKEDDGLLSIDFDFTEWSSQLDKLNIPKNVKDKWFLANSSHVMDLAFYFAGNPKKYSLFSNGSLNWHLSSSIFCGAGVTHKNILFSYKANWESAGRWAIELKTKKRKLILSPLEKLQIQNKDEIEIQFVENINYDYDFKYKPGFYLQTNSFINGKYDNFLTIEGQLELFNFYFKVCNYK